MIIIDMCINILIYWCFIFYDYNKKMMKIKWNHYWLICSTSWWFFHSCAGGKRRASRAVAIKTQERLVAYYRNYHSNVRSRQPLFNGPKRLVSRLSVFTTRYQLISINLQSCVVLKLALVCKWTYLQCRFDVWGIFTEQVLSVSALQIHSHTRNVQLQFMVAWRMFCPISPMEKYKYDFDVSVDCEDVYEKLANI